MLRRLLNEEKDERYRYLIRHGNIVSIEAETLSLYVELPQIPNIIIIYRRPSEREGAVDKMSLDSRCLKHVPLLEGEERVKYLNLQNNEISKIENLVSLPNLTFLDLSGNRLREVAGLQSVSEHLRVLILSKNQIEAIRQPLDSCLKNLDVLDLHENKLTRIENLGRLQSLRVLNLSNNLIEQLDGVAGLRALVELNLRKNKIKSIAEIPGGLPSLQKLYLSHNQLSSLESVRPESFPALTDLTLENNPVEKTPKFHALVKEKFPSVLYLNLQKFTLPTASAKTNFFFEGDNTKGAAEKGKEVIPEVEVKQQS